jgi:AcrR family transcriptional regulator
VRPAVRGPYKTGEKRRADIVAAAARVFGEYGYVGGSLRQIGDEVGVTPAALISHFGSKERLLLAVLDHMERETTAAKPPDTSGAAYFAWMAGLPATQRDHPAYLQLLLTLATEASNPLHPGYPFMTERYQRLVDTAIDEMTIAQTVGDFMAVQPGDFERECRAFIAILDGINIQWLLNPALDLAGTMHFALQSILTRWSGKPFELAYPRTEPPVFVSSDRAGSA